MFESYERMSLLELLNNLGEVELCQRLVSDSLDSKDLQQVKEILEREIPSQQAYLDSLEEGFESISLEDSLIDLKHILFML